MKKLISSILILFLLFPYSLHAENYYAGISADVIYGDFDDSYPSGTTADIDSISFGNSISFIKRYDQRFSIEFKQLFIYGYNARVEDNYGEISGFMTSFSPTIWAKWDFLPQNTEIYGFFRFGYRKLDGLSILNSNNRSSSGFFIGLGGGLTYPLREAIFLYGELAGLYPTDSQEDYVFFPISVGLLFKF